MIVVTGASGQLGTAFRRVLPEAAYLGRSEFDLSRPVEVTSVLDRLRPDLIVNCAAYTAVDAAETDERAARAVNAKSVGAMAEWSAERGARLVTFSTDYVFDGSSASPYVESSTPNPMSVYGRTKLEGEQLALAAAPETLVVRTSWVVSGSHPNFVATMIRLAREQELRVVDDQHGCPTVADDLAVATWNAIQARVSGLLHLTNQGSTTWYGLAREALRLAGLDPERVTPCRTEEFPRPAHRPANSILASERLADFGLDPLPAWEASLPGVVSSLLTWL